MADVTKEKKRFHPGTGATNDLVHIGNIKYEPKNSRIEINGRVSNISGQAKKTLDYLIEHRQRSVTRQELSILLWGTEDIPENRFYQAIKGLRKTLGDTQPWKVIDSPAKNLIALKPDIKFGSATWTIDKVLLSRNIIVLILFVLISISILVSSFSSDNSLDVLNAYTVQESEYLTDITGEKEYAAISPDGTVLLFTQRESRSHPWELAVKRLKSTSQSRNIKVLITSKKNEHNTEPSFSPSGQRIAWIKTDYRSYCDVMIADFSSDNLSIHQAHSVLDCFNGAFARTPEWKDEASLLVSLPQGFDKPNRIEELDLISGKRTALTSPGKSEYGDYSLFYHRESKKIAYIRTTVSQATGTDLRIYDFKLDIDYKLKVYPELLASVSWLNENNIVARNDDSFEVISVDGITNPLSLDNFEQLNSPFSIEENVIGFVEGKWARLDIVKYDMTTGNKDRSLSSDSRENYAVIAKISRNIVFLSSRNGKRQLFFSQNGKVASPIMTFKNRYTISDIAISPDGKFIAYALDNQINVIDNTGKLYFRENTLVSGLSFSYDSSQLVAGVRKDGTTKLFSFSINENFRKTEITKGYMPKIEENGDIYFFEHLGNDKQPTLSKISVTGQLSRFFKVNFQLFRSTSYDILDGYLYYVDKDSEVKKLVKKSLNSAEATTLFPISSQYFSMDASGTQILSIETKPVQNNFIKIKISQ